MEIVVDLFNQHSGNLDELKRMAVAAQQAGADWVKIQLLDSQKIWGDDSRKYLELSHSDYLSFIRFCGDHSIKHFATVFTEIHLSWVQAEQHRFKLATWSMEKDPDFCKKVIDFADQFKYPVFASKAEVKWYPFSFRPNLHYLFCVPMYPTRLDSRLLTTMPQKFNVEKDAGHYGYSDHCIGIAACVQAYMRGAQYIEKHFTLNPNKQCETEKAHLCSFTPETLRQFRNLVDELEMLKCAESQA